MAGALGGAVTQPLVVRILESTSWRVAVPIFGTVGIVFAVAWAAWFRDEPREHPAVNEAELALIGRPAAPAGHARVPWRTFASG